MAFWLGILFALLFVWLAVRCGFYETWIMLFNIVVSIYLGIFLRPFIKGLIPDGVLDNLYGDAVIILATSGAAYLILYGISYVFFSSQFKVSVPRLIDVVGSGFLGFLSGQILWWFVSFLICITPIPTNSIMEQIGFNQQFQQKNISYMSWWIDRVNKLVSSKSNFLATDKVIAEMIKTAEENIKKKELTTIKRVEQRPIRTYEPNDTTLPEITEQNKMCGEVNEPNVSRKR